MTVAPGQAEGTRTRFPSPFELATPPGCEGWEEMYVYHAVFAESHRDFAEGRFWFQEALHAAEPLYPFDAVSVDSALVAFNQANAACSSYLSRSVYERPLLNGLLLRQPESVTDQEPLGRRAEQFPRRGGYYYKHWDELYARWVQKVETDDPRARGDWRCQSCRSTRTSRSSPKAAASARATRSCCRLRPPPREPRPHLAVPLRVPQSRLRRATSSSTSSAGRPSRRSPTQTIAQMVAGDRRPRPAPRRRAPTPGPARARAAESAEPVGAAADEDELRASLARKRRGARWLADFEATKHPWFNFSYGNGVLSHHHRLMDRRPDDADRDDRHVHRAPRGRRGHLPPAEAVRTERDRITDEYRALMPDEEHRQAFDEHLALARTVFPYVENHNFYIDHWYFTLFWNKVREFGALLARHGFLDRWRRHLPPPSRRGRAALQELRLVWSSGGRSRRHGASALAADRGAAEDDLRGDVPVASAARTRHECPSRSASRSRSCSSASRAERLAEWLACARRRRVATR